MIVRAFGSSEEVMKRLDVVRAKIWDSDGRTHRDVELYVVPFICSPVCGQHIELAQATFEHLINLPLADSTDGISELEVDVLIGEDFYWSFILGKIASGSNGPVAVETPLGWVLSGVMKDPSVQNVNLSILKVAVEPVDRVVEQKLKDFWSLESIGVVNEPKTNDPEDFESNISFEKGRYTVQLPWKQNDTVLPDNYYICKMRLNGLVKRLRKSPDIFKQYDDLIKTQEKEGIIEPVTDQVVISPGKIHYIPHREVVRDDKETTKVRIVYDASAKISGYPSLNECLETGSNLLPKIFDVLIRFRCYKIGIVSDIKSAFHNIRIAQKDRDYLRFLWLDDIHKDNPELVIKRFTSVIFGGNSSPNLLCSAVKKHE